MDTRWNRPGDGDGGYAWVPESGLLHMKADPAAVTTESLSNQQQKPTRTPLPDLTGSLEEPLASKLSMLNFFTLKGTSIH